MTFPASSAKTLVRAYHERVMEPHGHGLAMGHGSAVPIPLAPSRPSGSFGHRTLWRLRASSATREYSKASGPIQRAHHPEPQPDESRYPHLASALAILSRLQGPRNPVHRVRPGTAEAVETSNTIPFPLQTGKNNTPERTSRTG